MSALKTYEVHTQRFGVLRILRESIREVRAWIATALPEERGCSITRDGGVKLCAGCLSAPCCCRRERVR